MTARDLVNGLGKHGKPDMVVVVRNSDTSVSEVVTIDYAEATNHAGEKKIFAILYCSPHRVEIVTTAPGVH